MIRITLRYTLITLVMIMNPGLEPVLPSGGYYKNCIHITWIGLPGRWQKHTVRCVLFLKKEILTE